MPKSVVTELTQEQEIVLKNYIEKWKAIAKSTKPIDRKQAAETIKKAYRIANYSEPEIVFFGSPFAAIKQTIKIADWKNYLGCNISHKFNKRVYKHLLHLIEKQLEKSFFYGFLNKILYPDYPNHLDRDNNPLKFNLPMGK